MLSQQLWQANLDLAQASLNEPFVQQLGNGELDQQVFCDYIAQDAFFLKAFMRAYALATVKCEALEQVKQFHQLIGGVLEELELHAQYAESLDIDLTQVQPLPACRAYTDFLLRTAWSADVDEIIAAMVPCMRLYAWLGQQLLPQLHDQHAYADWIETYSDPEFEALAVGLEQLLDQIAADTVKVRDAYRYAMICERDFFTAPLKQ